MSVLGWLAVLGFIAAFSAALVFVDPLTIIADWWQDRGQR